MCFSLNRKDSKEIYKKHNVSIYVLVIGHYK